MCGWHSQCERERERGGRCGGEELERDVCMEWHSFHLLTCCFQKLRGCVVWCLFVVWFKTQKLFFLGLNFRTQTLITSLYLPDNKVHDTHILRLVRANIIICIHSNTIIHQTTSARDELGLHISCHNHHNLLIIWIIEWLLLLIWRLILFCLTLLHLYTYVFKSVKQSQCQRLALPCLTTFVLSYNFFSFFLFGFTFADLVRIFYHRFHLLGFSLQISQIYTLTLVGKDSCHLSLYLSLSLFILFL